MATSAEVTSKGGLSRKGVSFGMYVLVLLFALSSWVDMEGVWAELPLLVQRLPEYWELPAYTMIASTLGNIGPLLYFVGNTLKPGVVREVLVIYLIIGIGCAAIFLQIFVWRETVDIGGGEHSLAFLALVFIGSITDATSSVAFLAYMAHLCPQYMSALHVGEGLGSLLPSLVSLIQGSGNYQCVNTTQSNVSSNGSELSWEITQVLEDPVFSVEVFFVLLVLLMVVSTLAFSLVNYSKWCRQFHVTELEDNRHGVRERSAEARGSYAMINSEGTDAACNENSNVEVVVNCSGNPAPGKQAPAIPTSTYVNILAQFGLQYGVRYGMLYPLQSYSLLPCGSLAYSLGNRLTSVTLPISSLLALFFPTRSLKVATVCSIIGSAASIFIIVFATMSPNPPLRYSTGGPIIMITAWVIMSMAWGYGKVVLSFLLRDAGRQQLMVAGAFNSAMVFICTVTLFIVLVVFRLIEDTPPC